MIIAVFTRLNAAPSQTNADYNKKLVATWLTLHLPDNYDSLSAKTRDMGTLTLT